MRRNLGQASISPAIAAAAAGAGQAAGTQPKLSIEVVGPDISAAPGGAPSVLQPGDPSGLKVIDPADVPGLYTEAGAVTDPTDVGFFEIFGAEGGETFWSKHRNKILIGLGLAVAGGAGYLILRRQ